jgi:hypothetical protein
MNLLAATCFKSRESPKKSDSIDFESRIGAGEGNRTLVTTKVVLSGIKWPSSLGNSIVV